MTQVCAALIGVNVYERHETASPRQHGWGALVSPEADVADMKVALQQCGWSPSELRLHEYTGSVAKYEAVVPFLEHLLIDSATHDSLVIIFFAGHADLSANSDLALALYNTVPRTLKNSLPAAQLRTLIDQSPARDVIVILDCCYAGAAGLNEVELERKFLRSWENANQQKLGAGRARAILASCWQHQLSRERSYGNSGHGVYTEYVLRGLRGDDPQALNGNGDVDAASLHRFITVKMAEDAVGQTPLMHTWGGSPPVLRRGVKMHDQPIHQSWRLSLHKTWQRADFADTLVASEIAPAGNPVIVATVNGGTGSILCLSARDGSGDRIVRTLADEDMLQLSVSPDSKYIGLLTSLSGTLETSLTIVPLTGDNPTAAWTKRDPGAATRFAFSPDSQSIAVCTTSGHVQVLALHNGQELAQFSTEGMPRIRSVAFFPDQKDDLIVTYDALNVIDVIHAGADAGSRSKGRKGSFHELVTIPDEPWFTALLDSKTIAYASRLGRLSLSGLPDGNPIGEPITMTHAPTAFARSPLADCIACGGATGDVYVVARDKWGITSPKRYGSRITDLVFSPDTASQLMAAATATGAVHLWNYMTGEALPLDRQAIPGETFLRFSRDGKRLLISHGAGSLLELWEVASEATGT